MPKITVATIGTIKVKMDVRDDTYADVKPPHVSLVRNGVEIVKHLYLSSVDDVVGADRDTKDAVYWVRDHKAELEAEYKVRNKLP